MIHRVLCWLGWHYPMTSWFYNEDGWVCARCGARGG